jgi:tRNA G10  N-methylase Trm11
LSWLKPGGFRQPTAFGEILEACGDEWFAFAEAAAQTTTGAGCISARVSDILSHELRVRAPVDAIVTSPPYANRLDYTRLWAPEVAVFEALIGPALVTLKRQQIGTNVVRSRYPHEKDIARLPRSMIRTLNAIRDDKVGKDSDIYYYPYFANYAIDLMKAIEHSARHVRRRGTFILFVRDTVRKDVLFGTESLAQATMRRVGFRVRTRHLHVVRTHVGLRRKGEAGGLLGLAQREWWLCFERV